LKLAIVVLFFIESGREFQIFGPKKERLSVPLKTEFTFGIENSLIS